MPDKRHSVYRIEVETTGREVYYVEDAASEDDARERVNNGAIEPYVSEVLAGQIVSVELESDDA